MAKAIVKGNSRLPVFEEPESIKVAQSNIANLGRNMAEHVYLIGRNLIWVKSQLKHGDYILWIEKNLWFTRQTASKFTKYTNACIIEDCLLPYKDKPNGKNLSISNTPAEILPGQFRTIIIDPPWPYGTQYDAETRRVASPYPEMTIEAIATTEFPYADDCILWFWTTHKFLPVSFEMIQDWGFDYKATLVWDKQLLGIGYWLRMQCEFCLLSIKGNPIWQATDKRDFISEARREHSRKPEDFYQLVIDICPKPIGEAFSRQEREGVECITVGQETEKFNE